MGDNQEDMLSEINIASIKKDEEKLKLLKAQTIDESETTNTDNDDISVYTHVTDGGVKVLNDTSSINRKAIFHDLDRLKHWRESVDHDKESSKSVDILATQKEELQPVMDKNIDTILNNLPDIDHETTNIQLAAEKLNELELKIARKYSLNRKV